MTLSELLKAVSRLVLMFHSEMVQLGVFNQTWQAIREVLSEVAELAQKTSNDSLLEATTSATRNMVLVLGESGALDSDWKAKFPPALLQCI